MTQLLRPPCRLIVTWCSVLCAHLHGPLHGCSPAVLWQQAGVDIECAVLWYAEEGAGQHVAVCCCDRKVWLQGCKGLQEGCLCNEGHTDTLALD